MAGVVTTQPASEDADTVHPVNSMNNVFIIRMPSIASLPVTNEAAEKALQQKASLSKQTSTKSVSSSIHHEEDQGKESCHGKMTSCRWVLGYLCCAARFAQSSIRQCIGMAVVCMTLRSKSLNTADTTGDGEKKASEFAWSPEFEGLILNAFNIGFFLSPIIGGHIAGSLGGKRVVLVALLMGAIFTICLPFTANFSDIFVVVFRIVAGLFLGVVDPAIQALWARWAPQGEKAQLTTCSYTGLNLAGIVTFFISGHLCDIQLDNGWPFIFYFFGGFTFMCAIPWMFLVYDSPEEHPRILDYEKALISKGKVQQNQKMKTPWKKMLMSPPFWAIVVAHVTYTWVTSWVMAYLPKYFNDVLKFDVKENGFYSSLPFLGRLLSGFVCGYLSDKLQQSGLLSTGRNRKLFQIVGCVGCSVCMLAVGFLDHTTRGGAVSLLVLALSFQNFTSVAFRVNHLDLAPRFAGVMMGISVTVAMAVSLTGPPITAAMVKEGTQQEWLGVFILVASINIIGAVIFSVFGSGDVQEWALPTTERHYTISVVVNNANTFIKPVIPTPTDNHTPTDINANETIVKEYEKIPRNTDTSTDSKSEMTQNFAHQQLHREKADGAKHTVDNAPSSESSGDDEFSASSPSEVTSPSRSATVPAKRALSHTVSMPAALKAGAVRAHNLLRKRISSSDLHNQNNDNKTRHNASVKPSLSTHKDVELAKAGK